MAFGIQDGGDSNDEVMNEINMTPLVDVMLVLLIIFIITVPVMKQSLSVELPEASAPREQIQPETIRLSVAADGQYSINGTVVADDDLIGKLQEQAAKTPQPQVHISGDKAVRYERVAQAMSAASTAGIKNLGFVTEPVQGLNSP